MNKHDTMQTVGWILCDMAHYIEAYDRELQTIERERGMTPKYNNPFAPVLRDWITDGWFDPTDTRFMYKRRAGFNPNQPRHPAGSPGSIGGRWRPAGGGNGDSTRIGTTIDDGEEFFPARASGPSTPSVPGRKPQASPLPRRPVRDLSPSDEGINFLKRRERFEVFEYDDGTGTMTIGYGHVILSGESFPEGVTEEEALDLLRQDVKIAEDTIQRSVKVPLTQQQYDALTIFTYNVGPKAFREPVKPGSKVLKDTILLERLNAEDFDGAADQMLEFNKSRNKVTGKLEVNQGLVNRRNMERDIFLHGIYHE